MPKNKNSSIFLRKLIEEEKTSTSNNTDYYIYILFGVIFFGVVFFLIYLAWKNKKMKNKTKKQNFSKEEKTNLEVERNKDEIKKPVKLNKNNHD